MDEDSAEAALEWEKTRGFLVEGLQNLNWQDLPEHVKEQMRNNPKMTIFAFLTLLVLAVPGLVATPLLTAIGMSGAGPAASSFAAWFQSTYGVNLLFSTLQCAGMGGYGVPIVNGVISGVAPCAGVVGTWFGWNGTRVAQVKGLTVVPA